MSRQQQLELLGLHCTVCGGPLKFEHCSQNFEKYACPSCGNKYRLPTDIDRFKEYRADMMNKFGTLSRRGAITKSKQDLLYDLDSFAKTYSDFVKDDSQYHLFYIAAITENFQIKFKEADPVCQEAVDTYRIINDASGTSESYPIDVYGKKIAATYKRWSTPRHLPLWSKITIAIATLAIVAATPILAAKLNRNLKDRDTGITVSIDSSDYTTFDKWRVKFDVTELNEESAEYSAATVLLKNESEKYILYDMSMLVGKESVQPSESLKITMPLPDGFIAKNTVVYYIAPDGRCELIKNTAVTEATKTITFETDHFSIYAVAERPFHISFLPENGTVMDDVTASWGSLIEKPADPVKEGYTFTGWFSDNKKWDFSSNIIGDNVTLTATWIPNEYTVTFDSNGGSAVEDIKVTYDGSYSLPTSSRTGYKFLGWFLETNEYKDGIWTSAGNLRLTAAWEALGYTLTLDTNGGDILYDSVKTLTYDSAYGILPIPTRKGHTFLGWFTAQHTGDAVTESTTVNTANDHTLYAHWKANVYNVTFLENGGNAPDITEKQITFGETFGALPSTTRTGYTFLGWYTAEQEGHKVLADTVVDVADNITLYALWSANGYTVTFDPKGASLTTSSTGVEFDSEYGTLPTVTRTGYTFLGWFTAENGGNKITADSIMQTSKDHTLYAHWQANNYTVSFNLNGGEGSYSSITVTFETGYKNLPIPERTGYTFKGWYTNSTGGALKNEGSAIYIDRDHTLYARWEANRYKISFDAQGGSVSTSQYTQPYDGIYGNLPTPKKYGHTFLGWFTEKTGGTKITSSTTVKTASEHTLYAHWEKGTYEISLNCGSGAECDTRLIERQYGSVYGELPTPTKIGYTFQGWYSEEVGGNKITSATEMEQEAHIIWAHWTASKYTVTLNAMGGTVNQSTVEVTYDSKYPSLPDPVREGYTFIGWYDSEYGGYWTFGTFVETPADHTLYARWEFPVTLDVNGGTLGYDSIMVSYNNAYSITAAPTRTGYEFLGWFTEKDGGDKITTNTKVTTDKTHTVYAHWSPISYTVTLDANGGALGYDSIIVSYDNAYGITEAPTRTGYEFLGWFTERDGGNKITTNTKVTTDKTHTLYAHWSPISYTVTFDVNGGECNTDSLAIPFDSSYTLPEPSKRGYDFLGWYTERSGGNRIDGSTLLTRAENHTLYAHWQASVYEITWKLDGGAISVSLPDSYTYGTTTHVGDIPSPIKEGMVFIGWYKETESGDVWVDEISSESTGDVTLIAKWYKADGVWNKPDNVVVSLRNTKDKSSTVTHENEFTLAIPAELWNMIAEGKIGIEITMYHYTEVTSQGKATATVKTYGTVNGVKTSVSSTISATGGGYGILGLEGPQNGSTARSNTCVTYTLILDTADNIVIGSYCTMSSNKTNDDVKTKFGCNTQALSYRFYNVEPENPKDDGYILL